MKRDRLSRRISVSVSAVCTAALCVTVGAATFWNNRETLFDFDGDSLLSKAILEKEQLNAAFDTSIAGFDAFLSVYGLAERTVGTTVYDDAGYRYIIRDTKGFLHYHIARQDAEPFVNAVSALRDALEAENIPFLFLQAPTKEIRGFTEYRMGPACVSYENSEAAAALLRERNVGLVSFREYFSENGTDPASLFYRTDHHWTTETAFEAFAETVRQLNGRYGWELDLSRTEKENWNTQTFPACFLGSMGRRVGKTLAGLDDYTFFEPAFETSFAVYYPKEKTDEPRWEGDFHKAFVRDRLLYADDVSANRYASYFQYDYGELVIENRLADNGYRVALIKDSFSLPLAAFLSTVVREIDLIDPREFDGDLVSHLLLSKPDLVIAEFSNSAFGGCADFIAAVMKTP